MPKDKSITDAILVVNYQNGDNAALAELVKRWHRRFCEKAFWIVKDADIAKDIAQDTWQTIMKKVDSINEPKNFGSWASRIVYTKSMDVLRLNSKIQLKKQTYSKEQDNEVVEVVDDSTIKIQVKDAVKTLPIHQQNVIKLFYVEDYSLKEIAELLQISVGTAKSRLFHAREKIKLTLKNRNYGN
jgi:RNA polymerase sigma-70 factor (ECF subfamily)